MAAPTPIPFGRNRQPRLKDALTGLLRGSSLEQELDRRIRERKPGGGVIAVIVLGIDRFRHLNDLLGYQAGDLALREAGARLARWAPGRTPVARLGGDEFAIVLNCSGEGEASEAAASVLSLFEDPVRIDGREIFLSLSAGLSLFPADGVGASALLRRASHGMSRVKGRGGSGVERFELQSGLRPEERYRLESALRQALEKQQLSLRYQPQVDRNGRLAGLEALLVWKHPEIGRVDPSVFIRLAEETGSILPIGGWVLNEACRQAAAWRASGLRHTRLAVNVSPLQFASPGFVAEVRRLVKDWDMPPSCLELELTEGMILRDIEESAARMGQLRALGVRIAIDDFGMGYSPLSYLHLLPLDTVKVDRSFIGQIDKPAGSLPVVHTITVMAHHRGLQVVAEGVETVEELELVRAARCDLAQGFLFGVPRDGDDVPDLLVWPQQVYCPIEGAASAANPVNAVPKTDTPLGR
jgi:diguanylate cyclase (GGDEF)-like protein